MLSTNSSKIPSFTRINSIKFWSLVSFKSFLINVADTLNLSAPGADSFAKPTALSNKSAFAFDALTISSFTDKPTLYEG